MHVARYTLGADLAKNTFVPHERRKLQPMLENIRLSFQGIFSHKMRSLLTMLGIIIGIAAIISIVSTVERTNQQIKESLLDAGKIM